MIAIVDYGVGNLFSLQSSFAAVGAEAAVTGDAGVIASAERVILPGVGAFGDAADKLRKSGLDRAVLDAAGAGKPLLGICLGMQLLLEKSYEYGEHTGLGLIPGAVRPIADVIPGDYKIPHIVWTSEGAPPRFSAISGRGTSCISSIPTTPPAAGSIPLPSRTTARP